MSAATEAIAATVRAADPDRYLSTLYAPEDRRAALFALYAFDAEIAGLRGRVREPMAGEVRLQWWRDALDAPDGEVTGHPVADALRVTVRRHGLPVEPLANLIEARTFDLYDDPMPSVGDLEGYCGETASAMIQLAALVLDPAVAPSVAVAAGHAGCARGIAATVLALPRDRARGQCFVPRDILAASGTDPERFVGRADEPAAARAVDAMVALSRGHHSSFLETAAAIPQSVRPAFLPLATLPRMLRRIESDPAAALERPATPSALRRSWLTFRHAAWGWPGL